MDNPILNFTLDRQALNRLINPDKKNIDYECGYPTNPGMTDYLHLYEREGIAKRVVQFMPDESWVNDPEIVESENLEDDTQFEKDIATIAETQNLFSELHSADELSGVGRFGVILIGLKDGLKLNQPIVESEGKGDPEMLAYLRCFHEGNIAVTDWEKDQTSERFGDPILYTLKLNDADGESTQSISVHWTRVIHLADNRQESRNYGKPRMKPVYNRLYDLRKLLASSAEMFWKGGFPGISFELQPNLNGIAPELDQEAMRAEFEKYSNGLQRYIAISGLTANSLAPQVADPASHVMTHLKAIAISLGVPSRIFMGSEQAELASSQDSQSWAKRVRRRQEKYLSPYVVKPIINRLIKMGVITEPAKPDWKVKWPDLLSPSESDKADVSIKRAQALQYYAQGNVEAFVPPKEFMELIMNLPSEMVDAIMKAAEQHVPELDLGLNPPEQPGQPGQAAAPKPPTSRQQGQRQPQPPQPA